MERSQRYIVATLLVWLGIIWVAGFSFLAYTYPKQVIVTLILGLLITLILFLIHVISEILK